jgi:energy-coupling factor transporter ATP-binding protein EcfA2
VIVCVMGPSAAGKSTLAKHLQTMFPEQFARVPVDFFFTPRPSEMTLTEYRAVPLNYEWSTLDRAITAEGDSRSTPDCDFEAMTWRSRTGGLPIAKAPIYVLDGMRPHPHYDVLVMLELDPAEQDRRLRERDARWGTTVAAHKAHLDATYRTGCTETHGRPDMQLNAASGLEDNATTIVRNLTRWPLASGVVGTWGARLAEVHCE